FFRLTMGSIISTSKEVKKISYLSCEEEALNVAPVSSFGITELVGLLMVNISTSQPRVFVLLGFLVVTMEFSWVMLALKKFVVGFTVLPKAVNPALLLALMDNPSPLILLSPSN